MNFDPNDAKWTAYLLNELGEADRNAVEAELAENPEAQKWLEEMRKASAVFESSFNQEKKLSLSEDTRQKILAKSREKRKPVITILPTLAAAAVVAISLSGWWMMDREFQDDTPDLYQIQIIEPIDEFEPRAIPQVSESDFKSVDELIDQSRRERAVGDYDQSEATLEAVLSKDRYNNDALREIEKVSEERWEVQRNERRASTRKMMSEVEKAWFVPSEAGERNSVGGKVDVNGNGIGGGGKAPVAGTVLPLDHASPEKPPAEPEVSSLSELMSNVSSPVVMPGFMVGKGTVGRLEKEQVSAPPVISPSLDHFDVIKNNPFRTVVDHPLSTFSIDVDTASYSVVRKFLKEGRLPPADAVRVEEMINYFPYDYMPPQDGEAFAAHMEQASCPWAPEHTLVRIALKGKEISSEERPALNLVYLLDVSGSMNAPNKLTLVKRSLEALALQLDERDRVAIVVYAGAAGLVLPTTSGHDSQAIIESLNRLNAGGGTAGGAGIKLAYKMAREQFVKGGVNRVILCTDGDFNIGMTQTGDMVKMIEEEAKSGVFLTALGFGMGNYKDSMLETLSNKGNGNYAYIDDFTEARKVLVDQMLGTMVTIAKDVKIQVEFNPAQVAGYRLIGYENRMLKKEDFNNDKIDAGEIGAGHTVTAFYEVVPVGKAVPGEVPAVDDLKYQAGTKEKDEELSLELLTLKVRHKQPDGEHSVKREYPLMPTPIGGEVVVSTDFRFASSVAAFGLWLRDPAFEEELSLKEILKRAEGSVGEDALGYRRGLLDLIRNAAAVSRD
mgnify:CR=1 FL=1